MDPLLQIAEDLERRDEQAAEALLQVERLQAEVEALRTHAGATAEFLRSFPAAQAALEGDERAAAEARAKAERGVGEAEAEVERARNDADRLAAERHVQQAKDRVHEAELWGERARADRLRLEQEAEERQRDAGPLETRAHALAEQPHLAGTVAPPAGGLHGVLDWGARARGELLVVHAGLATERDKVVREATELVAGVLGEPLTAIGVAGVRERLERALGSR
jgi:chromosome segregation ATPase